MKVHSTLLNLGCGGRFHPAWVNLDHRPSNANVINHDLRKPLPFGDQTFTAVYHSHVLEHLSRADGARLLKECHRILRHDGILRVAVPDLEAIARLYLQNLDGALAGDAGAQQRYEWIILELFDQMVRERSGGEMMKYWMQRPMPAEDFVVERMGAELKQFLAQQNPCDSAKPAIPATETGELHRWMYDRYSLGKLLAQSGFTDIQVTSAHESAIPAFDSYKLDIDDNGNVRKPDSLFTEAIKP